MNKLFKIDIRRRHILEGYGFISIWMIGFILFMAIPLGRSLWYSFQHMRITESGLAGTYIGWNNFTRAFTVDVEFLPRLTETMSTLALHVPLILIFAMFSALLLNKPAKGRSIFRVIFFLPVIVASGAVLQKLIDQGATELPIFSSYAVIQVLITFIPAQVLIPLLEIMEHLTLIMWDSGVQIIIFLAALQTIPPSLYEAAKIDGATAWESFWKITLPMITPMILVNILYTIVNSFTKTNNVVMEYIHQQMFRQGEWGFASALGWIYFAFIFVVILLIFYVFKKLRAFE